MKWKENENDRTKKMCLSSRLSDTEAKDQIKTKASLEKWIILNNNYN